MKLTKEEKRIGAIAAANVVEAKAAIVARADYGHFCAEAKNWPTIERGGLVFTACPRCRRQTLVGEPRAALCVRRRGCKRRFVRMAHWARERGWVRGRYA